MSATIRDKVALAIKDNADALLTRAILYGHTVGYWRVMAYPYGEICIERVAKENRLDHPKGELELNGAEDTPCDCPECSCLTWDLFAEKDYDHIRCHLATALERIPQGYFDDERDGFGLSKDLT